MFMNDIIEVLLKIQCLLPSVEVNIFDRVVNMALICLYSFRNRSKEFVAPEFAILFLRRKIETKRDKLESK